MITKTDRKLFRRYRAGYEVWDEVWENGGAPTKMRTAYTPTGEWIGDSKLAHRLCRLRGIKPEYRTAKSRVCSLGFCEKEQKWYGWSHRAIYGFGIGSKVEKGDCAYMPRDKADFAEDWVRFWSDPGHIDIRSTETQDSGLLGVRVTWKYDETVPNKALHGQIRGVFQPYPEEWGRGEWTAETLDDARQMACDFAEGVS